jgi:hypothetical protein
MRQAQPTLLVASETTSGCPRPLLLIGVLPARVCCRCAVDAVGLCSDAAGGRVALHDCRAGRLKTTMKSQGQGGLKASPARVRCGRQLAEVLGSQLCKSAYSKEPHNAEHLVPQQLKGPLKQVFASSGKAPHLELPYADRRCPQGDGLDHVGTAQNATVKDDLGSASYRLHHRRKNLDRSWLMVKLTAPVVRNIHHVRAVLDGEFRICRASQTFYHQRKISDRTQPVEISPGEVLSVAEFEVPRPPDEAVEPVPVTVAVYWCVGREAETDATSLFYQTDPIGDPGSVTECIKLIDNWRLNACGADSFNPGQSRDAKEHNRASAFSGTCCRDGTRRIEPLYRPNRREHHRQSQVAAEKGAGSAPSAHVSQDSRSEADAIERRAIPAQRSLELHAATTVIP